MPIEEWKGLGEKGKSWLTKLFKEIIRSKEIPNKWRNTLIPIYKIKGDTQNCTNYRRIKFISHAVKLLERVIERRLKQETHITKNQFGFMSGSSTMETIYMVWRLMERRDIKGIKKTYTCKDTSGNHKIKKKKENFTINVNDYN